MADLGADQVHLTDTALVLLEGCDLFRIGGPQHHRTIAVGPAGVVGGVAEVLHAISRKLSLTAGVRITHPQIEIADEDGAFPVGREDLIARGIGNAAIRLGIANPGALTDVERDAMTAIPKLE